MGNPERPDVPPPPIVPPDEVPPAVKARAVAAAAAAEAPDPGMKILQDLVDLERRRAEMGLPKTVTVGDKAFDLYPLSIARSTQVTDILLELAGADDRLKTVMLRANVAVQKLGPGMITAETKEGEADPFDAFMAEIWSAQSGGLKDFRGKRFDMVLKMARLILASPGKVSQASEPSIGFLKDNLTEEAWYQILRTFVVRELVIARVLEKKTLGLLVG